MTKSERQAREELLLLMEEQLRRASRKDLLRFTLSTMPNFSPAPFHVEYYRLLTRFAFGEIKKLAVFMPPQHGKSEGSTRRLPAFLLGINPDLRLAVVSYNAPKARKFNREIQRVIDCEEYADIFPGTALNGKNVSTVATSWLRNADEFEVVNHRGGLKSVGVGGPLTGEPVDVLIMDDLYKDAKTAWSPIVRESVADWYDTVAETRLHNDSRQLIVFTRWHEDDLAGKLLREQGEWSPSNPDGWVVCTYKAIKEGAPTEYDGREDGAALWPERHSLEKLQAIRERNPQVFGSLYQQDPKPLEGLLYERGFGEYYPEEYANTPGEVRAYTDTADTGADYLCQIIYKKTASCNLVVDVYYSQKPMEVTEAESAKRLTLHGVEVADIESNNGGRGFARNVERLLREQYKNSRTSVQWFTQTQNKQVRLFTHSASVQNLTRFPVGWESKWPEFYRAITLAQKEGRNAHDDAPDALTGTIEKTWGDFFESESYDGEIIRI